jgi:hypothetical protein
MPSWASPSGASHGSAGGADSPTAEGAGALPRRVRVTVVVALAGDAEPPPGAKPKPCAAAPSPSAPAAQSPAPASPTAGSPATASLAVPSPAAAPLAPAPAPRLAASPAPALTLAALTVAGVAAEPVVLVEPTMISVAPWGRLDDGQLFAWSRRLDGAVRMTRSFGVNVLLCPRCTRKMRGISTITEPAVVR